VTKIDSDRRQIDLRLVRVLDVSQPAGPHDIPPVGTLAWAEAQVIKKSQISTGYLLLKLPGHDRLGLLHRTAMKDELGQEFDADQIERGDEVFIEVTCSDAVHNNVRLADRPAPEDRQAPTPPRHNH
jgi:hypothetical protein